MTDINNVNNQLLSSLGTTQSAKKEELGQTDFLELMVAQMSNQNPLEPEGNAEFLSQMAQFGTVDGIKQLQQSFGDLSASLNSNQALQASALVGRTVLVPSESNQLNSGGTVSGEVELPSGATNLMLSIYSTQGELVRQVSLGDHNAGAAQFTWDGKTSNGSNAQPGNYYFKAEGVTNGNVGSYSTNMAANVDSVTLGKNGSEMKLNVAGMGEVSFNTIKQIK